MKAVEIIEEIKRLPRDEQTQVIEFGRHKLPRLRAGSHAGAAPLAASG